MQLEDNLEMRTKIQNYLESDTELVALVGSVEKIGNDTLPIQDSSPFVLWDILPTTSSTFSDKLTSLFSNLLVFNCVGNGDDNTAEQLRDRVLYLVNNLKANVPGICDVEISRFPDYRYNLQNQYRTYNIEFRMTFSSLL